MQRRAAVPLGLVWLLTVLGMWTLTTAVLAVLISARTDPSIAGLVGESALGAALACVVVGGPATGVALRVRRRHRLGPAALAGLAVAALVLAFIWSYMAASGTALRQTWSSVTPVFVITVVQLAAAFALRGQRPAEAAEPAAAEPEAVAEPEAAAAESEPAVAEAEAAAAESEPAVAEAEAAAEPEHAAAETADPADLTADHAPAEPGMVSPAYRLRDLPARLVLTIALKSAPGRNLGTDVFGTLTAAPVAGLRAVLAGLTCFSNTPNPEIDTLSPPATVSWMAWSTALTASVAVLLLSPIRSDTSSIRSRLFILWSPP
jgi:hypothetical protein